MKTSIFIFLFAAFLFISCDQKVEPISDHVRTSPAKTTALGVIPSDIGLHEIVLDPEHHTWVDLDNYYHKVVLANSGQHYFNNLKKVTIGHLVDQFNMLEKADLKTVEYYIKEQQNIELTFPDVFVKSLLKVGEDWPQEKVRAVAIAEYNKSMELIKTLQKPDEYMEKHQLKYRTLKNVAETYPNRWGY